MSSFVTDVLHNLFINDKASSSFFIYKYPKSVSGATSINFAYSIKDFRLTPLLLLSLAGYL